LAVVATVALLALGCSDDDDGAVAVDGATTSSAVAPGSSTTAATGTETDAGSTATTGAGPADDDGDGGAEPEPAEPETNGPPGSAAPWFLRPEPATGIVIEISAEDGAGPQQSTLDHLTSVLGDVSGKPVSVATGGTPPARDEWSSSELRDAADAAATASQGERAVFRLLFVHGAFAESDTVLGVSVRGDVAAIFTDRVAEASSPLIGPSAIETAVVTHEIGHLLGLVDLYRDTGRADPEHPGHSTNRGSVMYWAVESTLVTDLLTGGPPRDFDDADRADLAAIRDGA
jgi:hypothetical protein